jgi:hypothetical protein
MLWKNLESSERRFFEQEYEKDKKVYDVALEQFYTKHPE